MPNYLDIPRNSTIAIGMSGGVDSSVAAHLLKKSGFQVFGLFMKNWEEKDANGVCTAEKEYQDVAQVCTQLDIPYYSVNFSKEYWDNVFSEVLESFKNGYTPNPDTLCNREIKFKLFLNKALNLGADFLATGHYCQTFSLAGRTYLQKGVDPGKDQSYFLNMVNEQALNKAIFPLGNLNKSEVREIARSEGLSTSDKKDSTGICFIGERNFTQFLNQYISANPGPLLSWEGKPLGQHQGLSFYTIGQKHGFGLGGGQTNPWFVARKDKPSNTIYVVESSNHPALFSKTLVANQITWITQQPYKTLPFKCMAKIRYRQADQTCTLLKHHDDQLFVEFDEPQRAITPGQAIVFYQGDLCLGGATIMHQQGT